MNEASGPRNIRLLILSHHHPASEAIGAVRINSFVEHLSSMGCEVRQVRGTLAPPTRATDAAETRHKARITMALRRIAAWGLDHCFAIPDRLVANNYQVFEAARSHEAWRPDVILASGPPFSIFLVAARLSRKWEVPWISDYRDLWSQNSYYWLGRTRKIVDGVLERIIVKTSSAAVTVSAPLAEELRKKWDIPTQVVLNGYENDSLNIKKVASSPPTVAARHPLKLVYTGVIYPTKRDPAPLLDAMRILREQGFEVHLEFFGPSQSQLQGSMNLSGLDDVVRLKDSVSRAEALAIQRDADVLLLLMWNHPGEAGVYSGKVFEYIAARRPILMLGYTAGVAADLIRNRQAGIVANEPHEIASALESWVLEKRSTGRVAALPADAALGLSREDAARDMIGVIREVVNMTTAT